MTIKNVIFDLDGTLIDSAHSILTIIKVAFAEQGIDPVRPITESLIGPPLEKVITDLLTPKNSDFQERVMTSFKKHYDRDGYKNSKPYDGIDGMLSCLREAGLVLYIATNKRAVPTRHIIRQLGWGHLFKRIISLDEYGHQVSNKAEMLLLLKRSFRLTEGESVYVGDRNDDKKAATIAGFDFIGVAWGYGSTGTFKRLQELASEPLDILKIIEAKNSTQHHNFELN
jgi:phosphoglycolate phosphatase